MDRISGAQTAAAQESTSSSASTVWASVMEEEEEEEQDEDVTMVRPGVFSPETEVKDGQRVLTEKGRDQVSQLFLCGSFDPFMELLLPPPLFFCL